MTPEQQKAINELKKQQAIDNIRQKLDSILGEDTTIVDSEPMNVKEELDRILGPEDEKLNERFDPKKELDRILGPEEEDSVKDKLDKILGEKPAQKEPAKVSTEPLKRTKSDIPDDVWDQVMQAEGGGKVHNYAWDSGGLTKYGISQKNHPKVDVANLTEAEARKIWRDNYWNLLYDKHKNYAGLQRIGNGVAMYERSKHLDDPAEIERDQLEYYIELAEKYPTLTEEQKKKRSVPRENINGWFNRVIRLPSDPSKIKRDKEGKIIPEPATFGNRLINLKDKTPEELRKIADDLIAKRYKKEEPESIGFGEGALAHAAQGITFGMGENIGAASRTLGYWLGSGEDQEVDFSKKFQEYRKQIQDENRQFAEEHPAVAYTFDIVGGLTTSAIIPGAGLLKAAKVKNMGKVGQAAVTGGAEGALAGFGYAEDGEELEGTAYGAILGSGFSAGLSKVTSWIANKWADRKAAKAIKESAEEVVEDAEQAITTKAGEEAAQDVSRKEAAEFSRTTTEEVQGIVQDLAEENAEYNRVVYDSLKLDQKKILLGTIDDFEQEMNKLKIPDAEPSLHDVPLSEDLQAYKAQKKAARDAEYAELGATDVLESKVVREELPGAFERTSDDLSRNALEARGMPSTREEAQAAVRADLIGYMRFVTDTNYRLGSRAEATAEQMSSPTYIKRLLRKFKEAERKGLIDPASYDLYKKRQYLAEAVNKRRTAFVQEHLRDYLDTPDQEIYDKVYNYANSLAAEEEKFIPSKAFEKSKDRAREAAEAEFNATISQDISLVKKKFYETNMMLRNIDRNAGTELEIIQNDIYEATNIKNFWEKEHIDNLRAYAKLKGPSDEEIYKIMNQLEKGELADIPEEALEKVTALQKVTASLREASRKAGLDIKDRGPFYVPKRRKYGADYVRAMEAEFLAGNDISSEDMTNIINLVKSKKKKRIRQTLAKLSPQLKTHMQFVIEMQRFLGPDLSRENIRSFFRAKKFHDKNIMQSMLEADTGALHARKDLIPEFLVDKNVTKSLIRNITEAGRLIHIEPLARQLDMNVAYLRSLGMKRSAEAVMNYRKDVMGQYRKGLTKLEGTWTEKLALKYGDRVYEYKQMADLVTNAIYPNLIGTNPASTIRNLFQPLYKTIPEMGYFSPKGFIQAYVDAFKQLTSKEGLAELHRKGIITTELINEITDLSATSMTRLGGATTSNIRKIGNYLMLSFTMSDHLNRVVTANLAEQLVDDLLTKKSKGAMRAVKYMPPAIQSRVNNLIRQSRFESIPKDLIEETKRNLRNHYSAQTQLVYGVAGNSEFAREMPRMVTMMSKWPIAIGTDIAEIMEQRDRWTRFGQKYLIPSMMATGMAAMLKPEEGEEAEMSRLLLGSTYGGGYAPLNTMMEINLTSPIVGGLSAFAKSIGQYGEGLLTDDEQEVRRGAKGIASGISQFVPVVGAIYKAADRWNEVLDYEDPVNLLLPEDYEYDYED